jgi:ABC-type phosphate/phosphonate transport system ATPase subunit
MIISSGMQVALMGFAFAGMSALLAMLFQITRDNSRFKQAIMDLKELVMKMDTDQDETRREVSDLKQRFNRVEGQHDMVIRSGEILKKHNG